MVRECTLPGGLLITDDGHPVAQLLDSLAAAHASSGLDARVDVLVQSGSRALDEGPLAGIRWPPATVEVVYAPDADVAERLHLDEMLHYYRDGQELSLDQLDAQTRPSPVLTVADGVTLPEMLQVLSDYPWAEVARGGPPGD